MGFGERCGWGFTYDAAGNITKEEVHPTLTMSTGANTVQTEQRERARDPLSVPESERIPAFQSDFPADAVGNRSHSFPV